MVSFSFLNAVDPITIVFIVLLALLIVALLVVPMFTNKKRAKQTDELHRSLKPGDLIETVGGIIGTIKEIRQVSPVDKEMVIETGEEGSKTTMVLDIKALYMVMSRAATTVAPTAAEDVAEETPAREVPPILADRNVKDAPSSDKEQPYETEAPAENTQPAETQEQNAEAPVVEQAASEQPVEQPVEENAQNNAQKAAPKSVHNSSSKKKSGGKASK